ncbi:MAG: Hsp20/alpha crystallin family protein [Syntrophales bacterium]|nr:Hsp20/alpha crystallin family protein [Syntrophales bacterium]
MDFIKIRLSDERVMPDNEMQGYISGSLRFFEPVMSAYRRLWRPAVDICENENNYVIVAELPGVRSEDLHIEIGSRTVRIYGRKIERLRGKECRYRLAEISYGYFDRSLSLAIPIDVDRVEAVLSEGFLEIRIPKKPPDKSIRKISIRGL